MMTGSARTAWLLLAPALLLVGGVFGGGLVFGIAQSLGLWSLVDVGGPTLRFYSEILHSNDTLRAFALTCYVACTATVISLLLGIGFALLLRRMVRGAGIMRLLVQLPLPVPHMVAAVGMALLLAQSGLVARLLYALGLVATPAAMPPLIYDQGAIGIISAYVWKETPFLTLAALAVLQSISNEVEHAARNLGASRWQTLRSVTLPLLAPGLLGAAVIVWAFTFGAFEVPLVLGQSYPRMLAVEAFLRYSDPDLLVRPQAFALNICVAGGAALALVPYLRLRRRAATHTLDNPSRTPAQLGGVRPPAWVAWLLYGMIALWTVLPLVPLPLWSLSAGWRWPALLPQNWSLRTWSYIFAPATRALPALGTSLVLALLVTLLALALGVPAALALGRYRFRGRLLAEAVLVAPVVIPPLSVAMGMQIGFIWLGLADTLLGVTLSHAVFALPYVVLLLANTDAIQNLHWQAQARSLGATPWRAFWHVTLPLLRPSLVVAALLAFLVSWSQYALTLIIGGGRVWTLSLLLMAQARSSDPALVATTALLVVAPTLVFLGVAARSLSGTQAAMRSDRTPVITLHQVS